MIDNKFIARGRVSTKSSESGSVSTGIKTCYCGFKPTGIVVMASQDDGQANYQMACCYDSRYANGNKGLMGAISDDVTGFDIVSSPANNKIGNITSTGFDFNFSTGNRVYYWLAVK